MSLKILNKPLTKFMLCILAIGFLAAGCTQEPAPEEEGPGGNLNKGNLTLTTTTSTYDSGLLDYINTIFEQETGLRVEVISQGTGAALETGKRGDADALLVHDRETELELVDEGYFVDRHDVMYNNFILIGPEADPAGIKSADNAVVALGLIAENESTFVSRGDDSGTHRTEMKLWENAGIIPDEEDWHLSIGQGMGDTLHLADQILGYTIADRGTYIAVKDNLELTLLFEGDPDLSNQYGVMAVNPDRHPHVEYNYVSKYIEFLISDRGQELIGSYQVESETLFFPGFGLE